jgi:hypothetical protein
MAGAKRTRSCGTRLALIITNAAYPSELANTFKDGAAIAGSPSNQMVGALGLRECPHDRKSRALAAPTASTPTTVPLHDLIGPGLLRKILHDTGLTLTDLFTD